MKHWRWIFPFFLLIAAFSLAYLVKRGGERPVAGSLPLLGPRRDLAVEQNRLALAEQAASACGLSARPIAADPHLAWGDFLPTPGRELAMAIETGTSDGLLVLLQPEAHGWRLAAHLDSGRLSAPTSLQALALPGRQQAAVILTQAADQMAGSFSRLETCAVYAYDSVWRTLWSREIESEAYWNRAWDQPPGRGWVRLGGLAEWRAVRKAGKLWLEVDYRNELAESPETGRELPAAWSFAAREEVTGKERYRWDEQLGMFVVEYGEMLREEPLQARQGGGYVETGVMLKAGERVAVLEETKGLPADLLGKPRMIRVRGERGEGWVDEKQLDIADSIG